MQFLRPVSVSKVMVVFWRDTKWFCLFCREHSACGSRILPYVMGDNVFGDIDYEHEWDNAENMFIYNQKLLRYPWFYLVLSH